MNLRDPKNQIFIIVLILLCAVIYFWYTKVYASYEIRVKALAQEQSVLAEKLISVKKKAASLEQLKEEYKDLQLRYKAVELLLPEKKEDESLLSQIHGAAQLTESVVKTITPLGTTPSEYYETNNYSVEVESSYHNLGRFLAMVANFKFIVNLSGLQIKTSKEGSGATLLDPDASVDPLKTIEASFKLSTYNVKQGTSG